MSVQRFFYRRQFYGQLVRIVRAGLRARRGPRVFVSLMGGVGDLVNAFPSVERLSARATVDMGTGGGAYRALVAHSPYVSRVYAPFIYKPIRRAHRRLITRVLRRFYDDVFLLDEPNSEWRTRGRHMSAVYAERCGCPPPDRGAIYLSPADRARADAWLRAHALTDFVYVVQLVRHRRPERSWPLAHYQALYRELAARVAMPLLVHTVGSDETDVPAPHARLAQADILTVAALIERARLYVGPDTGPTHIAGALGIPTVAIHLGFPPEVCAALGDNVLLVRQERPLDDPARTTPRQVLAAVDEALSRAR